jgi:hypothetical protein
VLRWPRGRDLTGSSCGRSNVRVASAPPARGRAPRTRRRRPPRRSAQRRSGRACCWQPLVQVLPVDRWNSRIACAGEDLHGSLHLRQQHREGRKLGRVGAHVARRLDEAIALIGGEVVLTDVIGKLIPLDTGECAGDDLPRVGVAVLLQVWARRRTRFRATGSSGGHDRRGPRSGVADRHPSIVRNAGWNEPFSQWSTRSVSFWCHALASARG